MSFCTTSERFGAYAVTPVENLFIDEYMLRAPGDFVKVYLYGLRMASHPQAGVTVQSAARALGLDEQAVLDAYSYWERQGVLRRVSSRPLRVEYDSLIDALLTRKGGAGEISHYQDFNQSLQELFGERGLHPQDWHVVYDWIEVMGLKPEVVLLMVQHCVELKGPKIAMNYLDKTARAWSEKGVTTLTAAQEYLRDISPGALGAQAVLRHIGLKRSPTADEIALYSAWVGPMGFTHDAVIAACGEMTKSQKPNFSYLSKVLDGLHRQGAHTTEAIRAALSGRGDQSQLARDLLRALGDTVSSPDDRAVALIQTWLSYGFEPDTLRRAAESARLSGARTLADLSRTVELWLERGLLTAREVDAHLREQKEKDRPLAEILAACGLERDATPQDRKLYAKWADMSQDILLVAAGACVAYRTPLAYMDKLIAAWRESGVNTAAAARAYVALHPGESQAKLPGKEVAEHRYTQREYKPGELDHLLTDIMSLGAQTSGEKGDGERD